MNFSKASALKGEICIPGDKSISHRAVMLGALADGMTEVTNFLKGADCLSTIQCFRNLGIRIEEDQEILRIYGKGLYGLSAPSDTLDTGNSGTTTRLISGILSGQPFTTVLNGDASIQSRPMKRIMVPLRQMGADIVSIRGNDCAPLRITGGSLRGIHYHSPVASAQVKSAILLAGMYADSPTTVTEPSLSRNHSELMLNYFGGDVKSKGTTVTIQPNPRLMGRKVSVPGDISSAAYFLAAALIVPGSEVLIRHVGINPTRNGILKVARQMGADVTLLNHSEGEGEPTADLLVKSSSLKAVTIEGSLIPTLIDEIPILAVLACFAKGTTYIKDAQELKVKESNRIDTVVENLIAMGANATATEDGMVIEGGHGLHGGLVDSHMDHRIAMSFAVAALAAEGKTDIRDAECVNISYPSFYKDLNSLM